MGTWDETGEPVDVQQLLDFCHHQSVTDFSPEGKNEFS